MKNLTVSISHDPGTMQKMAEALGNAGVNIEGFCDYVINGQGVVQLVVDDAVSARAALEKAGLTVTGEYEVQVLDLPENTPGTLAKMLKPIADQGDNMALCYSLHDNKIAVVIE
mgnify:CR=1 FL=1